MVQYMCWPLLTGPIRFETKIAASVCSWFPFLGKAGKSITDTLVCLSHWLLVFNTYLYIFIYMLKGNITDGCGFEPQRFTGIRSLVPIYTETITNTNNSVVVMLVGDGGDQ